MQKNLRRNKRRNKRDFEKKSKTTNLCNICYKSQSDGSKDNNQTGLDLLGRFDRNRVLPELAEYWINSLESSINFFTNFGSRENDFARDEDQKDNLGIDHAVNQTRKQFRFILSRSVYS